MQPPSAVQLILQGKGGAGKSLVAAFHAQYLQSVAGSVHCIDTDPVNQTLVHYRALGARHLPLLDGAKINERHFDELMEQLLNEPGIFVVDNGASSFVPLSNYLIENSAIGLLADCGLEVFIHCVITGGQALMDTVAGFKALAEQADTSNIVVWLNEFFGPIEYQGKAFQELRTYLEHRDKVRGIVRIPRRNQDTFGRDIEDMTRRRQTFDEVLASTDWSTMAKQRIRTVQRDLFVQLDDIGF